MKNKIRHLRATEEQWSENDIVIDDGEIALSLSDDGYYRIKIGNGKKRFSELDSIDTTVKCATTDRAILKHKEDLRLGMCANVYIIHPKSFRSDFRCSVTFDSGDTPTKIAYAESLISFSGSSVTDGSFVPEANVHYTLYFWYDGRLQCHVRGVELV